MFNIPGVGRELIEAISLRDYSMVQGIVLMVASVIVFTNLIVDISYGYLDPRVRFS
jgi:peptide/nickel transport system permease protein